MEETFEKYILSIGRNPKDYTNSKEQFEQMSELFRVFLHFMETHGINGDLKNKLCTLFFNKYYGDIFVGGYSWRYYDYDFHYMLCLRWLTYLITMHKVYPLVYDVDLIKKKFEKVKGYSNSSHSNKYCYTEIKAKKNWYSRMVNNATI